MLGVNLCKPSSTPLSISQKLSLLQGKV